jgi:hypothetical protein
MLAFFTLAAVAPNRQRSFRALLVAHAIMLGTLVGGMSGRPWLCHPVLLGQSLLVAGIIEGALLVGWRLTQLPKSQALEFLLVSAIRPAQVLLAEALVGLTRLAFTTMVGLPILVLAVNEGLICPEDVPVLLTMPFVFGAVTGLGLACWAYEPVLIRRWGEKLAIAGILFYLVVGVLAGEHLGDWVSGLPYGWGETFVDGLRLLLEYNPFGAMQFAMEHPSSWVWGRVGWVLGLGTVLALCLLLRCAVRLHGHFHDEHYRPILNRDRGRREPIGEDPMTWWAVKRVSRYAGRINVWLAGGFAVLYAAYTVVGEHWPDWMGHAVFEIFDRVGGLPMFATALMVLASVPAAFQYGLWDSNALDRCRRLELLLLTELDGRSYWQAATAAAWRRGRGYFLLAILLWLAAASAERITWRQALAAISAGAILWAFYFALGFGAFARGKQANRLGLALTVLVPLFTAVLADGRWRMLAMILPPGSVYFGATASANVWWMLGPLLVGAVTLRIARGSLLHCEQQLREWYGRNHGLNVMD